MEPRLRHRSFNNMPPTFLWQNMMFNQKKFSSVFNIGSITQTLEHMLFTGTVHIVTVSFKKVQFRTACQNDISYKR